MWDQEILCSYRQTVRKKSKEQAVVSKRCASLANGKMGSKSDISRGTTVPVTDDKQNREKRLFSLGTQYCFHEDEQAIYLIFL
jgi:hypothetical protein